MSDLERIVEFEPAFDKRHKDPSKNYGIHGVTLKMLLKGEKGAVQFVVYTNWQLPHVTEEQLRKPADLVSKRVLFLPMPADLGYHSPKPMYEDQSPITEECPYLDGKRCYYDGSGLNAERIFDVLVKEGDKGVWRELEKYYKDTFSE